MCFGGGDMPPPPEPKDPVLPQQPIVQQQPIGLSGRSTEQDDKFKKSRSNRRDKLRIKKTESTAGLQTGEMTRRKVGQSAGLQIKG